MKELVATCVGTSAASILALMLGTVAQAQTTPQDETPAGTPQSAEASSSTDADDQTIIVTGSRIPRAGFDTVQPAMLIGSQQIDNRGYTNVGQALSELPAFGVPGNSPVGGQSSLGPAQTFVDFFSLGTQRTLTLVNGRRFVSSNTASIFGPVDAGSQVDLNVIPTALVDRIETVAVGGAPIYGSDAIAGTVNIILKRDFDGFQIEAQRGISQRGDAPETRLQAIAGFNFGDGRGNFVVAGEYNKTVGLATSSRFLTSAAGPFFTTSADPDSPFLQSLYYNQRYNIFTNTGIPLAGDSIPEFAGIFDGAGNVLKFNNAGKLEVLDFGERTGSLIESSGGNGFPLADYGNLLATSERYLANALGSYQVTDGIRFFGEAWYARSKGTNIADQPVYNTALFGPAGSADGNIVLSIDNPYLDPADRAVILSNLAAVGGINGDGDLSQFLLTRANTDLASGRSEATVELYRFVGGFDGDLDLGGRAFKWEVSANYGRSKTSGKTRQLVQQNFLNAIDAVDDGNGNIICRPGYTNANIATLNSTCSPLNLFGVNQFSQEALDYVTAIARPVSINEQLVFNANIGGALFTLPGGDVGISFGYEHRQEKTRFDPGTFYYGEDADGDGTREQFGRIIPIDPVSGKFHTNELFGELRIPLVSPGMGWGFIHSAELEGAVRYVDHSLAGTDWTWTVGGRIAPIEDVTFRGNFTRSIRAPAITEFFNPTSQAFETANDPCDSRFVNAGPNPAQRRANCIAAGIADPDNFTSNIVDFTSPISVSGNPDLQNERADAWTVGAIIRPRFVRGLTIAVDWVDISLKQAVVSLDTLNTLNACYDAAEFPSAICSQIDRDANGQVTFVRTGYANAASLDFEGLTAEIAYRKDLADLGLGANAGNLGLSINYMYLNKLETRVGNGDINTARGEIGDPKHSFTANINYENGPVNLLWQTQYFGKSVIDADAAPGDYQYPSMNAWWLFNATIGYSVNEQFKLKFIVDNVFDADPPFPVPAAGGTITYYSGILGRYFRAAATVKF